ncbi:MAG: murein DD-endopeptidase MepM/ murein hydrolase activator NlpD [Flavobacteriales bacterium]|jgi:murein DD-endopeptidase MepM/ murein hydrolase activator NlpD
MGRRTTRRIGLLCSIVCLAIGFSSCDEAPKTIQKHSTPSIKTAETIDIPQQIIAFGLDISGLELEQKVVKRNQFLADILLAENINYPQIDLLVNLAKPSFDFRRFKSGQYYHLVRELLPDSTPVLKHFIYEIDKLSFLTVSFDDSIKVKKTIKKINTVTKKSGGVITHSLYQTIADMGANQSLLYELIDIYAWTIDFYRIQKGDCFKVIYDENFVEGESIGIKKIHAATFIASGDTLHAISYNQDTLISDYFDEKGLSLRKSFLKSPIKYSRISSQFTRRRFHPVQKRFKAHLGTDYAAASGTPIKSVGDGVVIEAKYGVYNGRYVKVKHNSTYTTQYLHMSKIAKGMKPGKRVKQGQIIGYVGSTGLATGPHVCFRFWKNGQQVNHLKEKFPAAKPIKKENVASYNKLKSVMLGRLDEIEIQ